MLSTSALDIAILPFLEDLPREITVFDKPVLALEREARSWKNTSLHAHGFDDRLQCVLRSIVSKSKNKQTEDIKSMRERYDELV